jgi:hypothetical protein
VANKARRFSGRLKIELSYNDRTDQYKARLCPIKALSARCETVYVGKPRSMSTGVDAPSAYDSAARAAISFARPDIQEYADSDRRGTTWAISRGRRRYAKGHPKRR